MFQDFFLNAIYEEKRSNTGFSSLTDSCTDSNHSIYANHDMLVQASFLLVDKRKSNACLPDFIVSSYVDLILIGNPSHAGSS